jgi:NDP-sugar pyrophosphorylase family protein
MFVVITMAGAGSRFEREGYTVPKYRIRARGRTLFEWSLLSLRKFAQARFIFACLEHHDPAWILDTARAIGIRDAIIAPRKHISRGQAETALDALDGLAGDEPLWIYNIDTYLDTALSPADMAGSDGCLHVFGSTSPAMSYVRFDEDGKVVEVAEKRVISPWASVGVYGFARTDSFRQLYAETYEQPITAIESGERYVAPLFERLLARGGVVSAPRLQPDQVHILGTPQEVLQFDSTANPPSGAEP